jgi:RNA polymerase subunit RPABC4/transcription elongation factor Spt4
VALIKCKECGSEVSTKAKICPQCGAPVVREYGWLHLLSGVVILVIITPVWVSCQNNIDQTFNQQEAEEQTKEQNESHEWGISVDTYRQAKSQLNRAHSDCLYRLVNSATWGGTVDHSLNKGIRWKTDGESINIIGNDVKMKNSFNAERSIFYECRYDIKTQSATIISAQ